MESVLISDSGNTEQQADKVEHKNGDTQQLDGSKTESGKESAQGCLPKRLLGLPD